MLMVDRPLLQCTLRPADKKEFPGALGEDYKI
jgi:hypothetical protein